MKLRSFFLALSMAVLSACISTGGGGGKPPDPGPSYTAMDIVVQNFLADTPVEGVRVVCNGNDWGTTNADGYLLQLKTPINVEINCNLSKEGYVDSPGNLFTPSPTNQHMRLAMVRVTPPKPEYVYKPLRISGSRHWFQTDDGLFDWREVSAFSLQSRMLRGEKESAVRPLLQQYKALGFTVTRVMLTLGGDYWEGKAGSPINYSLRSCPDSPLFWENLDQLLDMHAEEGLRTRLVIFGALECFGGVWDPQARRDIYQGEVKRRADEFAVALVTRLRDQNRTHVQIELANEPASIGMRDSSRPLRDLGRRLQQIWPSVMINLGDVNGMDPADTFDDAFSAVDRHVDRNSGLWFIEADKRMGEDAYRDDQPRAVPAISGEPKNMGELRLDGRNGDVATHPISAYSYAAVTRVRQILPNFHYDGGLWTTPIKPETVTSMQAFHQALNAMPMVDGNRFRGNWGADQGNWWSRDPYPGSDDMRDVEAHIAAGRGPWRVFGIADWAAVFPYKPGLNPLNWSLAPADVVDRYTEGPYEVAIVKRR